MQTPRRVTTAVIPAAGLGTRFLPATKAQPKEMLPVVDKPAIQYVVEEAVAAGIDDILIITGRSKRSIEDHFDRQFELEYHLDKAGKHDELSEVVDLAELADIHYVRQGEALGLAHAVSIARKHVGDSDFAVMLGDDPFAILLPDDLVLSQTPCTKQLADAYYETGGCVVAVTEVPREHTNRYGILDIGADDGRMAEVRGLVEKPKPEDAPSNLSIIGRYVLRPEVIGHLARMERGAGNEVQLTDGMAKLIGTQPFHGLRYQGRRFDCGDKVGWLEAQIAFSLARPDMAPSVREFLKRYS